MRVYGNPNPIIQIDKVYAIRGAMYRVITVVTYIGRISPGRISLGKLVYIIENTETGERFRISENDFEEELT